MAEDHVQHGIDDDPTHDAEKGAAIGGVGGAVVGATAGSMMGPVGTVIGAVVGGLAGAGASGAAVAAVDQVDNDNTVSGLGETNTYDDDEIDVDEDAYATTPVGTYASNTAYGNSTVDPYGTTTTIPGTYDTPTAVGNGVPGVQTGGRAIDGTPDTRGISEKAADAVTGDRIDDKTGKPVL